MYIPISTCHNAIQPGTASLGHSPRVAISIRKTNSFNNWIIQQGNKSIKICKTDFHILFSKKKSFVDIKEDFTLKPTYFIDRNQIRRYGVRNY